MVKLRGCPGMRFAPLAAHAQAVGRRRLALMLLEEESSCALQVGGCLGIFVCFCVALSRMGSSVGWVWRGFEDFWMWWVCCIVRPARRIYACHVTGIAHGQKRLRRLRCACVLVAWCACAVCAVHCL